MEEAFGAEMGTPRFSPIHARSWEKSMIPRWLSDGEPPFSGETHVEYSRHSNPTIERSEQAQDGSKSVRRTLTVLVAHILSLSCSGCLSPWCLLIMYSHVG